MDNRLVDRVKANLFINLKIIVLNSEAMNWGDPQKLTLDMFQ